MAISEFINDDIHARFDAIHANELQNSNKPYCYDGFDSYISLYWFIVETRYQPGALYDALYDYWHEHSDCVPAYNM